MNRRTLLTILAVMAFGFATVSSAEAGGGGGKNKANVIYVVNQQFGTGVVPQNVIWLPNGQTPVNQLIEGDGVAFAAKGGKVLPLGGNVTFPRVAPGSGAVWLLDSTYGTQGSAPYKVKSGAKLAYSVGGSDDAGTIVQLQ